MDSSCAEVLFLLFLPRQSIYVRLAGISPDALLTVWSGVEWSAVGGQAGYRAVHLTVRSLPCWHDPHYELIHITRKLQTPTFLLLLNLLSSLCPLTTAAAATLLMARDFIWQKTLRALMCNGVRDIMEKINTFPQKKKNPDNF